MMIKSDNTAFYAEQNAVLPIDDLMARDNIKKEWFYPASLHRTFGGKAYGLPNVTAGALHMLFVDTGLLEKIGVDPKKPIATWQDLDALVEPAEGRAAGDGPGQDLDGYHGAPALDLRQRRHLLGQRPQRRSPGPSGQRRGGRVAAPVREGASGKYESVATGGDPKNVLQPEEWAPQKYLTSVNGSWFFFQMASSRT